MRYLSQNADRPNLYLIIDKAEEPLSEELVKTLHGILKSSTSDSRKDWFAVGDYKRLPNEVDGEATCEPERVHESMQRLIEIYNAKQQHSLEDILDYHVRFEKIHPFQDGNGRVGRLVMFKECLRSGVVPFIITDELKSGGISMAILQIPVSLHRTTIKPYSTISESSINERTRHE